MPDLPFGRYILRQRFALGGMAEIWLARQVGPGRFERSLVLKRILPHLAADPQFVEMFLDEAAVAAQLTHPNIAQVYDFGQVDGTYYLALELVRGPDLRRVLLAAQATGLGLPDPIAFYLATQMLAALDYAHKAVGEDGQPLELVHRDVSPQNVLLSDQGVLKLIDFGIAKAAGAVHETESGFTKGKLHYMAPEQFRPQPLDGRSDQYAAAIVTYELLTGTRAISGEGTGVIAEAMGSQFTPLAELRPDLPPRVLAAMERALQRDREARFPDCRAFAQELEAALSELGARVGPPEVAAYLEALQAKSPHPLSLVANAVGAASPQAAATLLDLPAQNTARVPAEVAHAPTALTPVTTPQAPAASSQSDSKISTLLEFPAAAAPHLTAAITRPGQAVAEPEGVDAAALKPATPRRLMIAAMVAATLAVVLLLWRSGGPAPAPEAIPGTRHEQTPSLSPLPATVAPAVRAPTEPDFPPEPKPAEPPAPEAAPAPSSPPAPPIVAAPLPAAAAPSAPIVGPIAAPPPAAPTSTKRPRAPAASGPPGKLIILTASGTDVTLDGHYLGPAPLPAQSVPSGKHRLRLRSPDSGRVDERSLEVKPGESTLIKVDLR